MSSSEWLSLRHVYDEAIKRYADAGRVIGERLAEAVMPTSDELDREREAIGVLTEAREAFWAAWRAHKQEDAELKIESVKLTRTR